MPNSPCPGAAAGGAVVGWAPGGAPLEARSGENSCDEGELCTALGATLLGGGVDRCEPRVWLGG